MLTYKLLFSVDSCLIWIHSLIKSIDKNQIHKLKRQQVWILHLKLSQFSKYPHDFLYFLHTHMLYTVKKHCNISNVIKRLSSVGLVGFLLAWRCLWICWSSRSAALPHSATDGQSVRDRGGGARCSLRCSLRTWTGTRFYISVSLKCLGGNANILPKTWKSRSCCCFDSLSPQELSSWQHCEQTISAL